MKSTSSSRCRPALFDDNHRSVFEIAHALPWPFARFDELHAHPLAGKGGGLEGAWRAR